MTYADRLNSFNTAVSQTQDHVDSIKNTLQNADLKANPVRTGLDMAGQVLGTADGLVRLRAGMKNDDVQRNVAKAIYNRMGDLKAGKEALSSTTGELTNQALNKVGSARQSAGSYLADNGGSLANSVKAVQSGSTIRADAPAISEPVRPTFGPKTLAEQTISEAGPRTTTGVQSAISSVPNATADARFTAAASAPTTAAPAPQGAPLTDLSKAPNATSGLVSTAAAQDVGGVASTGPVASETVAVPTSVNNGASLIPSSVSNALSNPEASISDRASALSSSLVPGLSTAGLASSDANTLSRAQQFAGDTHDLAQAAGSNVESALSGARSFMGEAGGMLGDVGALAGGVTSLLGGGSAGAKNSDEQFQSTMQSVQGATQLGGLAGKAGSAAKSGIQSALGVEEGLDALAPDTGPLAPILEGGSLLATLGTGIASIFESPTEPAAPPPPPPKPTSFAIGADLSNDASQNVGAF